MNLSKKTARPRSYPPELIERALKIASTSSVWNAARACGISTHCIRRHMRLKKIPARRRGNISNKELEGMVIYSPVPRIVDQPPQAA